MEVLTLGTMKDLSYRELQALAKARNVKANGKRDELVQRLLLLQVGVCRKPVDAVAPGVGSYEGTRGC